MIKQRLLNITLNEFNNQIKIYPNPVQNDLCISFHIYPYDQVEAILTDIYGNEIMRKMLYSFNEKIPTNDLPAGIYFLILKNDSNRVFETTVFKTNQ